MQHNMMGNIIITEPSSNLRALGRNALLGKWKIAIIAAVIYMLCVEVPPVILNSLFGINIGDLYVSSSGAYVGVDTYSSIYNSLPTYSPLSGIYMLLVTGPLSLGITLFFLAMFRKQTVVVCDIFLGFERFGKAVGLMIFQSVFIFLWSLLFIVPGIIAAIRYSQAYFILADNPEKGIRECMNESKMMMQGNKSKYFCLSLSFIGWMILASIPDSMVVAVADTLGVTGVQYMLISIIGGLFMAPVTAYTYSTMAGFYEILAGHLIKETEPAPVAPEAVPVPAQTAEEDNVYDKETDTGDAEAEEVKETADKKEAPATEKIDVKDVVGSDQPSDEKRDE